MTIEQGRLRNDVKAAVLDFQRIFPPPYRLAPNLDLAVRAIAALDQSAERLTAARARRNSAEMSLEAARLVIESYTRDIDGMSARISAARDILDRSTVEVDGWASLTVSANDLRAALDGDS